MHLASGNRKTSLHCWHPPDALVLKGVDSHFRAQAVCSSQGAISQAACSQHFQRYERLKCANAPAAPIFSD